MDESYIIAECIRESGEVFNKTVHRSVDVEFDPETRAVSRLAVDMFPELIYFKLNQEELYPCQIGGFWAIDTYPPQWLPPPSPPPPEEPPVEEDPDV